MESRGKPYKQADQSNIRVNPMIRNLVNQEMLMDDTNFLNLQMINRVKYDHIQVICQHLNNFIHDPETFDKIDHMLTKSKAGSKLKDSEKDINQRPFPKEWSFKAFGSSASGLNNQVENSDFDIALSPDVPIANSGLTFNEAIDKNAAMVLALMGRSRVTPSKLYKTWMGNYKRKNSLGPFDDSFPISLEGAKILAPKTNLQVTLMKGTTNMKLINKVDNSTNYEVVISRSNYNVINTEYLRLHAMESLQIFKFLLILKAIVKNTRLSNVHSFTSYAVNILGLQFLAQHGFLNFLSEFQPDYKKLDDEAYINKMLQNGAMTKNKKSRDLLKLNEWGQFVEYYTFDTRYDKQALIKSIKNADDEKFTLTSPKATLDGYNHLADTKFMIIWFFDWLHTLLDKEVERNRIIREKGVSSSAVDPDFCNVIDSRTGSIFNNYDNYGRFMCETYGFVPDIHTQRSHQNILTNTLLAVIDPFEVTHNIIRKDFDRKSMRAEEFQSLVFEIITYLNE